MARKWATFDDWTGGGFFADGSFRGTGRFRSLNMQTYANGSIGPRPQWRKLTQSADAASSVPSLAAASATQMAWGGGWSSYAPASWDFGAILLVSKASATSSRRIRLASDGTAVYHAAVELGQVSVGPVDMLPSSEGVNLHAINPVVDGSNPVYISGSIMYDPSANTKSNITPQVISAVNFYHTKNVIYKNRMYGWSPAAGTQLEYIVYSKDTDLSDFSGTDNAGNFRLSVAPAGFSPALPRGLWPIGSGLLIFSTEGQIRRLSGYSNATVYADFGRWYMMTGFNISAGTLTPLGYDVGPLFHSLSVMYKGKLMFPLDRAGWAIHDGSNLDKSSLANLQPRPVDGFNTGYHLWLHPFSVRDEDSLFLPFVSYGADPTSSAPGSTTDLAARYGEYFTQGYGCFEFVNGVWTEHQHLFGDGYIAHFESFDGDKLYQIHLNSSDAGVNYFPQIWTRDITLNRPATASSQSTYNPFSAGSETSPTPTGAWAAVTDTYMSCFVESAEFKAPNYGQLAPTAIVVDYDYWNSSLYGGEAGFDLEITYRSQADATKTTVRVTNARITPPGTSLTIYPNRARKIINLPFQIACGSFQVRAINVKDVAFHSFAVEYDDAEGGQV